MSIVAFWSDIHESGRIRVEPPDATEDFRSPDLAALVKETEAAWRLELPGEAPALDLDAAQWAIHRMYRACQFLAYREIEAEDVRRELAIPCPSKPSAIVCYSADLALRLLPQLAALSHAISVDDAVSLGLLELAQSWPLSSVGVAGVKDIDVSPFIDDSCLRQLYVDRVIERSDTSRLTDPRVAEGARQTFGAFPELASAAVTSALAAVKESESE